ncbi:hypothetical protein [Pseudoxanthomonas sp. PXM02]|uniref:hypothetical protein n=1 Tax=Pseudoxanthomonas sp. PXM02 TaxID=2769294 RepID=UPI00177BFA1D|nr:hypothetical protein [Pseudoxanthomonas sp. PXM02]MBD9480360.1 hypothetical protein [Pseudoxanthomonas sp. PXM02]
MTPSKYVRVSGLSALVVFALSLASCTQGNEDLTAAPPTDSRIPTQAQLDAFVAEGPEPSLQALRPLDYWLHYRLMQATGVEEALGGEAQAVAALKALAEDYERQARGTQAQVPKMIPAAFTGEGMSSGFLGLGMGTFGGLMTGGLLSGMVADASDDKLAELAKEGPIKFGGKEGGAQVTIGSDGSISQEYTYEGKIADGLTGKIKMKMRMDACPDAQGKVTVVSDVDSSVRVTSKEGTGGYARSHFVYERWLDDDAQLMQGPDGSSSKMDLRMGGYENYASQHVDISAGWSRGGRETFENRGEQGFSIFRPDEVQRTQQLMQGAQLIQTLFAEMMLRGSGKQAPWESGRCVELKVTSNPGKRKGIRPSTAFDIDAMPRAKSDGAPAGGTVTATLSGGASLQPSTGKVPADAKYAYAGPDKKNEEATIKFEARSKRGVGRATLEFDTKRPQAYTAVGGLDDFHGTGTICNLAEPFTISGGGNTVTFTPSNENGGSYSYQGNMGGIGVYGNGTYTANADDKGGKITGTGNGCVKTPFGTRCNNGTERYTLTPIAPCEQ